MDFARPNGGWSSFSTWDRSPVLKHHHRCQNVSEHSHQRIIAYVLMQKVRLVLHMSCYDVIIFSRAGSLGRECSGHVVNGLPFSNDIIVVVVNGHFYSCI